LGGATIDTNVADEARAGLDDDGLRCHGLLVARRPKWVKWDWESEAARGEFPFRRRSGNHLADHDNARSKSLEDDPIRKISIEALLTSGPL
jgi:hypothetical protein